MKPHKVNRWLTLGANFGVLIGIILLVVELDQNREMIRAQTRNDISQQLSNRLLTIASDSQAASVMRRAEAGEEITADEEHQYLLYWIANVRDWENMHYQYRNGMFDESEFNAEVTTWKSLINRNRAFEKNWCRMRQNFSAEYAAVIDSMLADDACTSTQDK